MNSLPIDSVIPAIREALTSHTTVVLQAPPGAGKTTRLPPALLDEPWLAGKRILMLEPRRLAARAAAGRMAEERGEEPGRSVGYRIRFESRVSAETCIEVVTEGILARRLQHDPELEGVGLVIFDEFHERHLHSDLGLALCRDVQAALRDDLRLLVMSATLDGEALSRQLDAPLIRSEGRSYPVDIRYLQSEDERPLAERTTAAIRRALRDEQGDILAFLPGAGEIRRVERALAVESSIALYPLYGNLGQAEQRRAILPDPQGRRKVVLATPIAETSLTIEGVSIVVDAGYHRAPRFDPRSGLARLELLRISKAAAEQRAGRAGRLGPGICYRLWSESTQRGLIPHAPAELAVTDLAPLALDLAQWGVRGATELQWIEPPPAAALAQARQLLGELEALDQEGRITPFGREMARLPLHPRLAHMLLRARELGLEETACDIAALLSERDLLRERDHPGRADFAVRLELLAALRRDGMQVLQARGGDAHIARAVERGGAQIRRLLGLEGAVPPPDTDVAGELLALAYPERIALRREQGGGYRLASGSGAKMAPGVSGAGELIVCAELEGKSGSEALIRSAATLTREALQRLYPRQMDWQAVLEWDSREEAVRAERQYRYRALVLERRPAETADPEGQVAAMIDGIRAMGLECLPWDAEARQLQARLLSLRAWLPEAGWPDVADAALLDTLEEWLAPYLNGISRRSHLSRLDLKAALLACLDWNQQQRLNELAPSHLQVPSGSRKRLEYADDGAPPVLAVKLQEMFGLADTPRIAGGRVAVMLHLLSPAQRPIQVTQDLRGFWERTYAEVKKELKGRYPKHPWPDDPWSAQATARAKPRR